MTLGNYAVSWGNTDWGQSYSGKYPTQYRQSAFGHNGQIGLNMIVDGTSNSVFMAEVLQGALNDVRGLMWDPIAGGSSFMTRYTPNGTLDYLNTVTGGDYIENPFCTNDPVHQLPCTNGGDLGLLWIEESPSSRINVTTAMVRSGSSRKDQSPDLDRGQYDHGGRSHQ